MMGRMLLTGGGRDRPEIFKHLYKYDPVSYKVIEIIIKKYYYEHS